MLLQDKICGVDSEWKISGLSANKSQKDKGPAILQISSPAHAFVIDLHALNKEPALDSILQEVFCKNLVIGFGFSSDLSELKKHLPKFSFYKKLDNLIDIQTLYTETQKIQHESTKFQVSLGQMCEQYLGKKLCKGERMSNWERRPLRLS